MFKLKKNYTGIPEEKKKKQCRKDISLPLHLREKLHFRSGSGGLGCLESVKSYCLSIASEGWLPLKMFFRPYPRQTMLFLCFFSGGSCVQAQVGGAVFSGASQAVGPAQWWQEGATEKVRVTLRLTPTTKENGSRGWLLRRV